MIANMTRGSGNDMNALVIDNRFQFIVRVVFLLHREALLLNEYSVPNGECLLQKARVTIGPRTLDPYLGLISSRKFHE